MSRSKLFVALTLVLFLFISTAHAEEQICSEDEIKATLTGHEIKGIWNGKNYLQTFNEDGSTIYKPENMSAMNGKWFVKDGKYCSDFGSGENCYKVARDGDTFYWIYEAGARVKFTVSK